jgi:hypothetical protein
MIGYHDDISIGHSIEAVNWLYENSYDTGTIITVQSRDPVPDRFARAKDDLIVTPNFIYSAHSFTGSQEYIEGILQSSRYANLNVGIIFGAEKPHVLFKDGKWVTSHLDKTYSPVLNMPHCEFFYASPDAIKLHVKQTHMLKRYAKMVINPTTFWVSSKFGDSSPYNHAMLSQWLGLDANICVSNAINQKTFNLSNKYNIKELLSTGRTTPISERLIMPGNSKLAPYINSLKALQADATTIKYMHSMNLLNDEVQSIDQYNGIYSKFYDLGA